MTIIYDPSNVGITQTLYAVETTGDQLFVPTTGFGDNPDSGTMAQRLAQCQVMDPQGVENVV